MTIRQEYLLTKILFGIVLVALAFGLWDLLKG
jgi:hypothetical protein